jgi:hypothetical protein
MKFVEKEGDYSIKKAEMERNMGAQQQQRLCASENKIKYAYRIKLNKLIARKYQQ